MSDYQVMCVNCGVNAVDIRYFWNQKINSYELEYHCTVIHGFNGCGMYRVISLNHRGILDEC